MLTHNILKMLPPQVLVILCVNISLSIDVGLMIRNAMRGQRSLKYVKHDVNTGESLDIFRNKQKDPNWSETHRGASKAHI